MSGGAERYIDPLTETAIGRLRDQLLDRIVRSPVYEVSFAAANTPRDVQHGLGVIPTGFIVILSVGGGRIDGVNMPLWTPDLAFLQSNTANVRARLYFLLTEVPTLA